MTTPSTATIYVAFSIHGTNTFIVARQTVPIADFGARLTALQTVGFSLATSRRPGFDGKVEAKLHWTGLLTKAGRPLRCPQFVVHRMRKLKTLGFELVEEPFINYHFRATYVKQPADSVPR